MNELLVFRELEGVSLVDKSAHFPSVFNDDIVVSLM